jgi:hypothetical protein
MLVAIPLILAGVAEEHLSAAGRAEVVPAGGRHAGLCAKVLSTPLESSDGANDTGKGGES